MNEKTKETYKDPIVKVYACCPLCSATLLQAEFVKNGVTIEILTHYSELINAVDFFFVYQRMYNGNCLNIRNECAHARKYIYYA